MKRLQKGRKKERQNGWKKKDITKVRKQETKNKEEGRKKDKKAEKKEGEKKTQ